MATTRALAGQTQTVLGPIAGEAMGITLPHEHLLIDFEVMFREPGHRRRARALAAAGEPGEPRVGPPPLQLQPRNLQLLDEAVARDEALLFKHAGGQTFVDPTNRGLARDPLALARVARATGLNIIMGSGYYVDAAHPPAWTPGRPTTSPQTWSPTPRSGSTAPGGPPASSPKSAPQG